MRPATLDRMSTRSPDGDVPIRRIDRILTFMALGLTALSIVCFFTILFARPLGVTDFSAGIWPLVALIPYIALPVGFLLIVTVLIMSFARRARANGGR